MPTIYCKCDHAILLAAVPDSRGVLRFPSNTQSLQPGLHVAVRALIPIYDQLTQAVSALIGQDVARQLHIWDDFADELTLLGGNAAIMYVASLNGVTPEMAETWPVMPAILRALPKNRGRLPYLRAWQVLQGGLQLNTKAIEAADLAKHFDD